MFFVKQNKLKAFLSGYKLQNKTIGFVPTMGALHRGHLSLMKESLSQNHVTVVSIFVNPTQFNNPEDLKKYPRTLESDIEKINNLNSEIIIFAPETQEMYPKNTFSENFDFDGLEFEMEGKHRPGHFDGVGTIVKKLFEIVTPNKAYFGEKDFQQLQIIKKLVEKHQIKTTVVGCSIYREVNGLAMSSRNERLSEIERNQAKLIYEVLTKAKKMFITKSAYHVSKFVEKQFLAQNMFQLEYFEIANENTLKTCQRKIKSQKYRAFIAVFVNNIRLIDNISLI